MIDIYFIAEIGQNHQGSLDIAKQMVDTLVGTGVSAIKTAKRDIDVCLTEKQKNMPYVNKNSFGETYYEHRKALELSKDDFRELKEYVESKGFHFISSFTDQNSLDFLVDIDVKLLKIASQRTTDIPLLKATASTNKPVIISTGMCNLHDVNKAIGIFSNSEKYVLQCTSIYPCEFEQINLNVLNTYKEKYGKLVDGFGFSGHHSGIAPDLAAFMMGIDILERHFTLHRHWKGSDHSASLEIDGIKKILKYIDQMVRSVGSSKKSILPDEQKAINKLRGDLN